MNYTEEGLEELNRKIKFLSKSWLRYRRLFFLGTFLRRKLMETQMARDLYFTKLREQERKIHPERFIGNEY